MADSPQQLSKPSYRTDIDGLRAIAVLLVIFYHLGLPGFSGGYIGVDVFFVISGFLISGNLLRALEANAFSFATFYEHRVRRIAPALLFVLACTTYLAHRYLFPPEFLDFAHSLVATLFSVSNLFFLANENYFDQFSQTRPLLHTWSLAVEEQYYLVFPIVLVAIFRWCPRHRKLIVWLLSLASLFAACLQVFLHPTHLARPFYLSYLRAWELLLGTLLYDLPAASRAWQRQLLAVSGLLLILIPGHLYTATTFFPGLAALPPCLGAAMLLHAGSSSSSLVARVLAWRPLAFIGIISYSLYLFHWPFHVFQTNSEFLVDASLHPRWVAPAVLAASLLAAVFSWYFVETPFRKGKLRPAAPTLYLLTGSAFAVLFTAGLVIDQYNGWQIPHIPYTSGSAMFARFNFPLPPGPIGPGTCFVQPGHVVDYTPSTCLTTDPNRVNWLLYGDSHALALYHGLHTVFPEANVSLASLVGCRPGITPDPFLTKDCNEFNRFLFHDYVLHHHVDRVLLEVRWGWWSEPDLTATVAFLQANHIATVVFGPALEFDQPLPRLVLIATRQRSTDVYSHHMDREQQQLDRHLADLARNHWHVPYISAYEDLCSPQPVPTDPTWQVRNSDGCPIFATPETPMLWDGHHFSLPGSVLYAEAMRSRHQLP